MPVPGDGFVGLAADQNVGVEVLTRYAEFWKIPNKPVNKIPGTDVDTIFCSGRPEQAFDGKKVVISPSGPEDAARIAQDYGLTVATGIRMISLPVSPEAQVSIQTQTYDFQGSQIESVIASKGHAIPFVGFWKRGKDYALAVTHDVETREGLENGCMRLYDVEQKLHVRSTWNVPSDRYPLSNDILSKLAVAGELGAHDTRHDGRLVLADFEAKVKRVGECRTTLEQLSGKEVRGFRSPLLQHSHEIVEALGKAGYTHDSSIPSWEILSPTSLGPHGIGTVFPFIASGIVEVPVSLPQDHQLLRVVGLNAPESIELLHKFSHWISSLGGACVLLVHPDYDFGLPENQDEYRRLLEVFTQDPKCDIITLDEIARWWSHRDRVSWSLENGRMQVNMPDEQSGPVAGEIHVKLATDYDDRTGLRTEPIS